MLGRRQFAVAATAALPGVIGAGARRARAQVRTLRIGYILPVASQLGAGASMFADQVNARTNGRIAVQQFPDSMLGGDVELLKGVQIGSIDLAFATGSAMSSLLPELGVLNIPFLFNGAAHGQAVMDGPVGESFRKLFAAKDAVMLAWGENGVRHMTNSRHPIVTPDDLKGLRMRVPQSQVLLKGFQALGAEVAQLPFPQVYEALRSGKFDGEENPIATIRAGKFDQVQKFLTLSAHTYDPAVFLMSADAYEDLSAEDKASFVEAAKAGGKASRAFTAQAEAEGVATLRQAGMTVQTSVDRAAFAAAMAGAMAEFEKSFGHDIIAQIKASV